MIYDLVLFLPAGILITRPEMYVSNFHRYTAPQYRHRLTIW
jgi:hypothetical protein